MDLREVIAKAKNIAESAHSSFHAGRLDDAEKYLGELHAGIHEYFGVKTTPAGDVTESATSEKPADVQTEKPAEVPGAGAHPAAVGQTGQVLPASQFQTPSKPTQ